MAVGEGMFSVAAKESSMEAYARCRWSVLGLAAGVTAAALLAGCGVRLSSDAAPSPRPAAATAAPPVATLPTSPSPSPYSPPLPPPSTAAPAPAGPADAEALAAALRRVEAAAQVKLALPQFEQLAADMVARSGVPGAAVAVVAGDGAVYVRCFGLREIGLTDAVDKDTLFQLGAVSQTYTTTMLAALVGEGEIGWDQPLRRVWPGFRLFDRWASREATYRDLTAQRSGLPAYAGSELLGFGYGRAEILRRLRYLRPAAGFRAAYAPQDAVVTAAAVAAEKATGESWARLVRARVLDPIGAVTTALTHREYLAASDRAAPHRLINGSMQPQDPPDESVFAPSLGVSASIAGLVPYVRMLLNGGALAGTRVAPAGAITETLTPTTVMEADAAGPEAAALGWQTLGYDGRLVARGSGDLERGSGALVSLVPADGVGVIVLANAYPQGRALGRALTRTLLDLYVRGAPQDDWFAHERALAEAEATAAEAGPQRLPPAPSAAAPPRPRSVYAGVYEDRYYGSVTVRAGAGDGLSVRFGRGETLRYVPWDADTWRDVGSGTAAEFVVRDGHARGLRLALLAFDGRDGRFERRP